MTEFEHVMKIPNEDTYTRNGDIYKKEALQKAYLDYIGGVIQVDGIDRKLTDVTISDEFIILTIN